MATERIASNLYLLTKATGTRYSIARFKRNGKQFERSPGNAETISLRSQTQSGEWVCTEVLPTIRKTHRYQAPSMPDYPTTLRLYAEQLEKNMALEK